MKRTLVAPLAEVAYKIFSTPSASTTEKAVQFAGCVAHQAASSHLPKNRADAFGRLAAQHMLSLVQTSYQYSATQAEKNAVVQQAKADQAKAQVPWIHTPALPMIQNTQIESLELVRSRTVHEEGYLTDSESVFKSKSLKQNQLEIESSSNIYPKAFCVAFLAFERASKTKSQKAFEAVIKKELMRELADPFSYSEFFLQVLKSREMGAVMGVLLLLGIMMLALPSFGIAVLPELTTTYAVGGSATFVGGVYHLWRFFSVKPAPKTSEENPQEMLIPQTA
ncbi:MAG: hypothetical protein P1U32_04885 [Legionellaceae bacterium]|nr:hypothetical protein [Legionellaceae bacterium]